MPGAVAAARNISGGVNPSVKLPAAPQPFWLEGPLEPPIWRTTICFLCTLQRACYLEYSEVLPSVRQIELPQYLSGRAEALWRRALLVPSAGRGRLRGPSVLDVEKEKRSSTDRLKRTQYAIKGNHCASTYAIEVVNITDEPALVAEPGWLQDQRLAP